MEEEEEKKEEVVELIPDGPKDKSEEDYTNEREGKIQEMSAEVEKITLESPLASMCETCSLNKAEFYCDIKDERKCKAGAAGKRYFCVKCSNKYHDDHGPKEIAEVVKRKLNDWISFSYAVKISYIRAKEEFKNKKKLL